MSSGGFLIAPATVARAADAARPSSDLALRVRDAVAAQVVDVHARIRLLPLRAVRAAVTAEGLPAAERGPGRRHQQRQSQVSEDGLPHGDMRTISDYGAAVVEADPADFPAVEGGGQP